MFQTLATELRARQVTLVAVSKTQPLEQIIALYRQGQRIFGENKAQEMKAKYEALPKDIEWHMIGHLQTNKVKYIAPFVRMIHSVDSLNLLQEIDKQARKSGRVIDCLLQFYIAREETKFGLELDEARALLESAAYQTLTGVRLCGVMGMASFTDDTTRISTEFQHLRAIFEQLKAAFFPKAPHFREISMGMSSDWQIAVEAGSTMVRIGSLLFGPRS